MHTKYVREKEISDLVTMVKIVAMRVVLVQDLPMWLVPVDRDQILYRDYMHQAHISLVQAQEALGKAVDEFNRYAS